MLAASALAESACPPHYFPRVLDEALLPSVVDEQRLLEQRALAAACPELAADLAQLYFWGSEATSADLSRARHYAELSGNSGQWPAQMRTLRAVFQLDGHGPGSVEEAHASLRRELVAGDLRRDKALAAIRQFALLHPSLDLSPLFALARQSASYDARYRLWRQPFFLTGKLTSYLRLEQGGFFDGRCTASLIAPQWLISAAHCLNAPAELGPATLEQLVYQPFTNAREGGTQMSIERAWVHRGFSSQARLQGDISQYSGSDIALLKLAYPVEGQTGRLGVTHKSALTLQTSGFPQDKSAATLWASDCNARREFAGGQAAMPIYSLDCPGVPGQSGALLYSTSGEALGVISANLSSDQQSQAMAAMFTRELLADVQRIVGSGNAGSQFFREIAIGN